MAAQFDPRTGISSYKERIDLTELLGGEPVPSASAVTTPVSAPAAPAMPSAQATPGMLPAAPAAPIGGWRWGITGESGGENPGYLSDWIWDTSLAESQGYGSFNDGSYSYVAPPSDPTGVLEMRSLGINEGTDMGQGWFDTGSNRQVNDPAAIQRAQIAQQAAADARVPSLAHLPADQQWQYAQQIQQSMGIEALARAANLGKFSPEFMAQLGPYIAARQNEASDSRGFMSHVNDWVGTDLIHVENMLESWQEDPERALLGINTPAESKLWGWLLGEDYDANMNMYGGPNEASYQESAEAGNDPRARAWGQGVAESIGGAMLGAWAGGTAFGQTALGQGTIGAARTGIAAANGGDSDAMRAAIVSALVQQGVDVASPYVASWINDTLASLTGESVEEVGLSAQGMLTDAGEATKRMQLADSGTGMTDVSEPLFSPNSYMNQPGFTGAESSLDATVSPVYGDLQEGVTYAPGSFTGYDPITGQATFNTTSGMLTPEEEAADAENLQTLEAGDTPPEEPLVTSQDVTKYAKVAKTLYGLLNPDSPSGEGDAPAPADAPVRDEETTDEQYAEQLASYANLDAAAMAEAGLTPGTPEYYEYIMTQMDSIIEQALEGVDVDSADLATQLRAKTAEEMKSLERALFVRGQMAQLMGSGTYTDPATGLDEEVVAPEGMLVNPGRAGFQRGLARSANQLGRLRGADARKFLGGMLDRDVDFYGMQGRADERADLEEQYLLEEERKRRRGMFSGMGF